MKSLTAVAYARYSSDKQQESSIVVQLSAIRAFCKNHNITLTHEYVDEAQTGTNANRKSFQQMISDAVNKEFQLIIVHRMDRLARNVDDARYYKKYLLRQGVRIISTIEEFDESPEGEFFELMSLGMAELYSKKLAREAAAGKIANAKEGKVYGGVPLLGYTVRNKHYVIDDREVDAVKKIFELFTQGYGYKYIRSYLNSNGYKHSDGRPFTAHFYDILRNRRYIGEYVYNRSSQKDERGKRNNHKDKNESEIIRIEGAFPRIIDDDTFNKAQAILNDKHRSTRYNNGIKRKYLLSGLLRCGYCGHSVSGNIANSHSLSHTTYQCCDTAKVKCHLKAIRSIYLDEYVEELLLKIILTEENAKALFSLIKICYLKSIDSFQKKKNDISAEIKQKQKEMAHFMKQAEDTVTYSKVFRKCLEDEVGGLSNEVKELRFQLRMLEKETNTIPYINEKSIKLKAGSLQKSIANATDLNEKRNEIIKIVHRVTLKNDAVETTINLSYLLDSAYPITCTIVENRDSIAHFAEHNTQASCFADLKVRV